MQLVALSENPVYFVETLRSFTLVLSDAKFRIALIMAIRNELLAEVNAAETVYIYDELDTVIHVEWLSYIQRVDERYHDLETEHSISKWS